MNASLIRVKRWSPCSISDFWLAGGGSSECEIGTLTLTGPPSINK